MSGVEPTVKDGNDVGWQGAFRLPYTTQKGARMTHNYTYDEMFRAADKLWPGEAEDILADPTDDQLTLILSFLRSSPVGGWNVGNGHVVETGNNSMTPLVNF